MAPIAPDDFQLKKLISKIQADRGFDFSNFRMTYIARRVGTRLAATEAQTVRDYTKMLDENPEEYGKLLDALTVNVSEFFRDRTVWRFVEKEVVPEVVRHKRAKPPGTIRVWSAGCSTGQEPYSVAMLFSQALAPVREKVHLAVVGTDIDQKVLEVAKRGVYPMKQLHSVPPPLRSRYTVREDEHHFRVGDEIREVVRFRRFDLFADKPISAADLIMCRNVMIYFDRGKQLAVYEKLVKALRKGGFLVVGRSEKLVSEIQRDLVVRNLPERVYQRPTLGGLQGGG